MCDFYSVLFRPSAIENFVRCLFWLQRLFKAYMEKLRLQKGIEPTISNSITCLGPYNKKDKTIVVEVCTSSALAEELVPAPNTLLSTYAMCCFCCSLSNRT